MISGRNDRGQALMESILLGLVLLAPLIWLLTVLGTVHRAALATSAAAREAGWEVASAVDVETARNSLDRAVSVALKDQELDPGSARIETEWAPGLERGTAVLIQVSYPVPVLSAPFLGSISKPVLWIEAVHVARIDPFRSRE